MKLGLKYATHGWGYYLLALVVGLMFLGGMGTAWYTLVLNAGLVIGIVLMAFNDGAYLGEKACTLAASLEKQVKEGRRVDEKLKNETFKKKTALWILIAGVLPFLLLSTVNVIVAPMYPEVAIEEEEEADTTGSFVFDYDGNQEAVEAQSVNVVNVIARLVFMPYVTTYSLVPGKVLNWLFFLYSLPVPVMQAAGYLLGPKLREKKLKDIARGKKRKMRNLKVHKKPRQQKAEV